MTTRNSNPMGNLLITMVIACLVLFAMVAAYYAGQTDGAKQAIITPEAISHFADTSTLFIPVKDCSSFVEKARANEREFQLQGDGGGTRIKFWSSGRIDSLTYHSPERVSKNY